MKQFSFILIILMASLSTAWAQSEKAQVQKAVEQLFKGMQSADSALVSAVFTPDAAMYTIAEKEGEVGLHEGALAGFLKAIGTPHEQVWDERISRYDIRVDGDMATVWAPYQFYLGDQFSHCGVNAFQLIRQEGQWKIFHITDTRRKENCPQ